MTGDEGPSPFKPCQKKTKVLNGTRFSGCRKGPSPTAMLVRKLKDGLCARLRDYLLRKKKLKKQLIFPGFKEIQVLEGEHKRKCYHENKPGKDKRRTGWCATCRNQSAPGEHGYCGEQSIDEIKEQEFDIKSTNWGYCMKSEACER